ncbi:hypothetical protein CPB83DRAFT_897642 [Crepidotus variabilis]|uniref:Uncharacterized protein n=1 Tax=Crepidotus variabilis TaxID=179855 RepID=A0A9P6E941_9AGAR|nr:hypothetical protein CPB83DRAFT_897642 [Crepidotus variabilis]
MCFYPAFPYVPGSFVGSLATWRQHSFIVSCLTVTLWDFLEFIPEDIRLFQEHPFSVASFAYEAARVSTLMWFVSNIVHSTNPNINMNYLYVACFVLQRGTTSMLFYLRVYALYRSNRTVQVIFGIALLVVIIVAGSFFQFSGVVCGVFDVGVFFAILKKLGWQPEVAHMKSRRRRSDGWKLWSFWSPFQRNHVNQIRERFLRDSLMYVLLAIVVKIPQIILLVRTNHDWELLTWVACSIYVDLVISSVTSSRIFRDMKLGLHTRLEVSSGVLSDISVSSLSHLEFRVQLGSRTDSSGEV